MKKGLFWKIYGAVVAVALVVIVILLIVAGKKIDKYDKALPEHIADNVIEEFKAGSAVIDYPELGSSKYDPSDKDAFAEYKEKLSQIKEWSYKINSGITSSTEMVYGIFGDGELMAYLKLTSKHSETVLAMLAVNDWTRESLSPVTKVTTYTLTVDIPTGFSAAANGAVISESEKNVKKTMKNGNTIYEISDLLELPQVEVYDRKGNKCSSTAKDGYVSVDNVTYYSLILPKTIKVTDQGADVAGEPNGGDNSEIKYLFGTVNDSIELTDALGQTITYSKNEELTLRNIKVSIPENYTFSYSNISTDKYFKEKVINNIYKYVLQLNDTYGAGTAVMPEQNVYEFPDLLAKPEFVVKDYNGEEVEYQYDKDTLLVERQTGLTEIPEEYKELEAAKFAHTWSEYIQGNLGGDIKAFEKVAAILIEGSYLYDAAYLAYENEDIKIITKHTSTTKDKIVKRFVAFSENLVSCDVYIRKIHKFSARPGIPAHENEDISQDTYYFYKLDGEWKLVEVNVTGESSRVELP